MKKEKPSSPAPSGKLLRLKQGYNPNSSSIGTMIFAMPMAALTAAVAFGTASGLIYSAFTNGKKNPEPEPSVESKATRNPTAVQPEK